MRTADEQQAQRRRERRRRWIVAAAIVAALVAILAIGEWLTRPELPRAPQPAPSTPQQVVVPPIAVAARRTEVPPPGAFDGEFDPDGKGRLTVRVVDAATRTELEAAWVALAVPVAPLRDGEEAPEHELRGYHGSPVVVESYWTRLFVVGGCDGWLPAVAAAWVVPSTPDVELELALPQAGAIEIVARGARDGAPVAGVAMVAEVAPGDADLAALFEEMGTSIVVEGEAGTPRTPIFPSLPPRDRIDRPVADPAWTLRQALARLAEQAAQGHSELDFLPRAPPRWIAAPAGRARASRLVPGERYAVVFWPAAAFQHGARRPVVVPSGGVQTVELALEPVNVVSGRVLFEDGTPAPEAVVYVTTDRHDGSGDPYVARVQVDAQGAFELPANRWRFLVMASLDRGRDGGAGTGFGAHAHVVFAGEAGERRDVELRFSTAQVDAEGTPALLRGRVVRPDGAPAAGAYVHAGAYGPRAICDEQGRFVLHGGFGALAFELGDADREERLPDEEFRLTALLAEGEGLESEELRGAILFRLADLAAGRELEIRLGR